MTKGPKEAWLLAPLTSAFAVHSGLTRLDPMDTEPLDLDEVHLKEHFLSQMMPDLVGMVRKSCVTWKTYSLSSILQYAEHAEEQLQRKDDQKKQRLEDVQLAMFNV